MINIRKLDIFTLLFNPTAVIAEIRTLVRHHDTLTAQCAEYRSESLRAGREEGRLRKELATTSEKLVRTQAEYDKLSTITRIYTRIGSDGAEN